MRRPLGMRMRGALRPPELPEIAPVVGSNVAHRLGVMPAPLVAMVGMAMGGM